MNKPFDNRPLNRLKGLAKYLMAILGLLALCAFLQPAAFAQQQSAFRFQFDQTRITVPVGSTNVTVVTAFPFTNNSIYLVSGATNASLTVSGLPAGANALLTDTNGNSLTSLSNSQPVEITLYTTNIPEGLYIFNLNAGGFDTNGLTVTNSMPFVLQAAHIWNGGGYGVAGFGYSNYWAVATNWLGGSPGAADDVVFGDYGAQTNDSFTSGFAFTNVLINASTTVGSIRFAQDTFVSPAATNTFYHTLNLASGVTLSVTGTNGFGLLRDYMNDFGVTPDNTMGVNISGVNSTLFISNSAANFSVLLGNTELPTLNMSNLPTLVTYVSRVGIADYQVYPNYRAINAAYNGGRTTNTYAGYPRHMVANVSLAMTNFITATYVDPNNYTNEFTRGYGLCLQNNEQSGNGSSTVTYFLLGLTNVFNVDGVCFIGSSSASGNNGGTMYSTYTAKNATNPGTIFRGPNGTSRVSVFSVSDDGGTNEASSNVKANVDFSAAQGSGQGYINLLADRLYVARDRTLISSNQSPNVQGNLTFGNGIVDVNSMYLGYQEHSNKIDWTTLYGAAPYLNYCQGFLYLTNGGYVPSTVKVNGNLTLGYTADINPVASAQQYNTYGQVTISSNVTMMVSNVICDGGLNYYDGNGRLNAITINRGGTLIVSNTIGFPNSGANDFSAADPRGMYLDSLSLTAGKLGIFASPTMTNVFVRNFSTFSTIPSTIKVMALSGVSSFPIQFPVISYVNGTSPFLTADVSTLGAGYYGYVLNNIPNSTVDLFITTTPPNNLVWTGAQNNQWDTTSKNWVLAGTSTQTNFNLGDIVTFNDTSTVTNVYIPNSVVPSQTGVGVTISNFVNQYTFSGGTVAGTAQVVKAGTNLVEFDATEQGPINITAGTFIGDGAIGTTIVYSNVLLNYTGNINGGLTSTGTVIFAGTEVGPISIQGGFLDNSGSMSTTIGQVVSMAVGTVITNESSGTIAVGALPVNASLNFDVPYGSTLANFGLIQIWQPKMSVEGLLYGTGTISYPHGGGYDSIANTSDPRLVINTYGIISPGSTPINSIGSMNLYCRFDYNNDPENGQSAGAGVSTVRIEVDFSNPSINDVINCDRWNNDTGYLLITNINPTAGSFQLGQTFQIFNLTSGQPPNIQDTLGFCPTIMPYVPGPGLVWGVTNFNQVGSVTIAQSPNIWDGNSSQNWSTNVTDTSWKVNQTYADNQGSLFNDSATSGNVNLTGVVQPGGFTMTVISNVVSSVTNFTIITNQENYYPGMVVSNSALNYVISGIGHIRGMTGLYKTGPGTLTLLTSNDFFGNVIVDNGTLAISNNYGYPNISSLGLIGAGQSENDIILDGGTLNYVGTTNVGLAAGKGENLVFNAGGATIGVASANNILTVNSKGAGGVGSLTKTGPGTLILSSTVNYYLGGTFINAGYLELSAAAVGFGPVTLNTGGTLLTTNAFTLTNSINVAGTSGIQLLGNSTNIFTGPWSGNGSVTISNNNLLTFGADISAFTGTISMGTSTGTFQFNTATNKNPCIGSTGATFNLGTGTARLSNLNGSNLVYNLGALSGGSGTILTGRSTNSASATGSTYSIGANGSSTTFSGIITNGSGYNGIGSDTVSIIKVGSGSFLLNGTSTYTGSTTVSSGVLGGTGSITSPLTVTSSGTMTAGSSSSVGIFTVNSTATLSGASLLKLNQANPAQPNDKLVVTGTLTGGGTLTVTNIGTTLTNGATFVLFNKAVTGFTSTTLPAGYVWNNNLAVNGSITLVSGGIVGVNTTPTNIVATVSSGVLTLTWPFDHTGWRLLVQTNPLSVGLYTNWFTVPGSASTDSVSAVMNPVNGSVFYRLVYP